MTPLEHALAYAARGWRVAPIPPGRKYPADTPRWQEVATSDAERIIAWWTRHPDHGVCLVTGADSGVWALDVDPDAGGDDSLAALTSAHGELPDTVQSLTGGGGAHYLFAWPDTGEIRNSASGVLGVGLDVRGTGGQIVVAPSVHGTLDCKRCAIGADCPRHEYRWEIEHDPLDGIAVARAPAWLLEALAREPGQATPRRPPRPRPRPIGEMLPGDWWASKTSWPDELVRRGWTLHSSHSDAGGEPYELWTRPGKDVRAGASASLYWQGSDVLKVFSTDAAPLRPEETYTLWGFEVAHAHGGDFAGGARAVRRELNGSGSGSDNGGGDSTPNVAPAAEPPKFQPYTVLGNARRLVTEHGRDLHHVPQWGAWITWQGERWVEDFTGEVHRRSKAIVDGFPDGFAACPDSDARKALFGWWMRSQSPAVLSGMVQLASTEPDVPVLVDQLDADPWALNTSTGTIDLRTGVATPQHREALCTKLAPATVVDGAECPRWLRFLDWAMRGDAELVEFLRRAIGYTLSGSVAEQVLFFLHGAGSNGKSTFLSVIGHLLGDYAFSAEADLLLAVGHERHSTGVADLHGRRMVVVQEIDEGRRRDEARVKRRTGGDNVTARRMRQDNFEFRPSHKLWMAANHRPVIRGTDHAIWRRIRLIPFMATVDDADKDADLVAKLLEEGPGILQWALQGCREWIAGGLAAPAAVLAATASYRSDQDHIGRFIEECCTLEPSLAIATKELRAAYEKWCFETGEKPWSAPSMATQLQDRGCINQRTGQSRLWRGIALAGEAQEEMSRRLGGMDWASRAAGEHSAPTVEEMF